MGQQSVTWRNRQLCGTVVSTRKVWLFVLHCPLKPSLLVRISKCFICNTLRLLQNYPFDRAARKLLFSCRMDSVLLGSLGSTPLPVIFPLFMFLKHWSLGERAPLWLAQLCSCPYPNSAALTFTTDEPCQFVPGQASSCGCSGILADMQKRLSFSKGMFLIISKY